MRGVFILGSVSPAVFGLSPLLTCVLEGNRRDEIFFMFSQVGFFCRVFCHGYIKRVSLAAALCVVFAADKNFPAAHSNRFLLRTQVDAQLGYNELVCFKVRRPSM